MSRKAPYLYFLFFLFLKKERKVPSHTSLPGGKEKIMVWTRPFKKVSPCREANDRKAKLPKFEQSVLIFKLSSSNDRALYGKPVRGGTNS